MPWFRVQIRDGDLDAARDVLRDVELEPLFANWVSGGARPSVTKLAAVVEAEGGEAAEDQVAGQLGTGYRLHTDELRPRD